MFTVRGGRGGGFRRRSAGNTELETGRGLANPELDTREGLGRGGGEGGGRHRNTHNCRLCTAQKAHRLRSHAFVYLNGNFSGDDREVSCSYHMGGLQPFSNRPNVLWKGCPFQSCTKVPYGLLVALHRAQEAKGTVSLSLSHTHMHTAKHQEKGQKESERRERRGGRGAAPFQP